MRRTSLRQLAPLLSLSGKISVRREILRVAVIPSTTSLKTKLEFLQVLYNYAPEVRLHPDDKYRPSSVKWFLDRVHMRRHRDVVADVRILDTGRVNIQNLVEQSDGGQHSGGNRKTNFFIQIQVRGTRKGENAKFTSRRTNDVACYGHLRKVANRSNWWDFQYMFFFPFSGNPDIPHVRDVGAHEGDWEHITVRVNMDDWLIKGVYFAVHETGYWADVPTTSDPRNEETKYRINAQGQPIVYSAWHTHATYSGTGPKPRLEVAGRAVYHDKVADGGPIWNCRGRLKFVGERSSPTRNQEWIKYSGRWGEIGAGGGRLPESKSGPYSPAFQDGRWWLEKEREGAP